MGIFSLVPRIILPVTSQLTTFFKSILCDLKAEAVKPSVKNELNKSFTSSYTIAIWETFLYENNCNFNSYKLSYR